MDTKAGRKGASASTVARSCLDPASSFGGKNSKEKNGLSVADLRAYLKNKNWRGSSLFYPRHGSVASTAANLVQHVVDDVKKTRTAKILDFTKRFLQRGGSKAAVATTESSDTRAAAAN